MKDMETRATTRLDHAAGTARPATNPPLPQPSGLTQDEIRRIVLDLLG